MIHETEHNKARDVTPEPLPEPPPPVPGPWSDPLPPTIPESPPGDPETWPFPPPVPEPEPVPEPVPTAHANKRIPLSVRIGAAAPGWRKAQPLPRAIECVMTTQRIFMESYASL